MSWLDTLLTAAGEEGPQGPQGPAGAALAPTQWLNATSYSLYIACAGATQAVVIDTEYGAFDAIMPSLSDGQELVIQDATVAGPGNWGTTPAAVTLPVGMKIERPNSPGEFFTATSLSPTYAFPGVNSATWTYVYLATPNVLKLIS